MKAILWLLEQVCVVVLVVAMVIGGTAAAKFSWAQAMPSVVCAVVALFAGGVAHVLRTSDFKLSK